MNEPSIVLHVGFHKTASSSLQEDLFPNCPDLTYLDVHDRRVEGYLDDLIAADPIYYAERRGRRERIDGMLSVERPNVISSEALSGPAWTGVIGRRLDHRAPILDNLKLDFPDARILLVVRRQDHFARSMYRQFVKTGGTAAMAGFLGERPGDPRALFPGDRFRYAAYVERLMALFPAGVLVLPFELLSVSASAFLEELCGFVGVAVPATPLPRRNSTRIGSRGLSISRRLNYLFRNPFNPSAPLPRLPLWRRGAWRSTNPVELLQDHWPGRNPRFNAADTGLCEAILKNCSDDNRRLAGLIGRDLAQYGYY